MDSDRHVADSAATKRRSVRTGVRVSFFLAAIALASPWVSSSWASLILPAQSPFVVAISALASRTVGAATLIGVPMLLVVLVRRRWFCRWCCPLGLCAEWVGRHSPVSSSSFSSSTTRRMPRIGRTIVFASVAGACIGFPFVLWLDPLAMFCSVAGLTQASQRAAGLVAVGAVSTVLLSAALFPNLWCFKICPLGAMQELVVVPWTLLARRRRCVRTVAARSGNTAGVPRRSILVGGVTIGFSAFWVWRGVAAVHAGDRKVVPLRPPGCVDPWQFGQLCIRCGNCARACPAGIIHADFKPSSAADWLTPVVHFETGYCHEDCDACLQVCPSGAIRPLASGNKRANPIGRADIDLEKCILAMGRECRMMCHIECPFDAVRVHKWSWEDDREYPVIDLDSCPGCGACVVACTPMDAITVRPLSQCQTASR